MIGHLVAVVSYVVYVLHAVAVGTWHVCVAAFRPGDTSHPAIVEFPLRCATDGEIAMMASSITITPGTLVVGTAAGTADAPPTLFVHALFGGSREEVVGGLREMETKLLRATRGPRAARDVPDAPDPGARRGHHRHASQPRHPQDDATTPDRRTHDGANARTEDDR